MYERLEIGLSPITGKIYIGKTNQKKPHEWVGEKRDVTNNFLQVLIQKFEPGTSANITIDGKPA